MRETLLVVLDEALVVHGLMPILAAHIEPLKSRGNSQTTEVLEPKLLVVLNLLGVLGANLLTLSLPSLFQLDAGRDFPNQSSVDLTVRIPRECRDDLHKKARAALYHTGSC